MSWVAAFSVCEVGVVKAWELDKASPGVLEAEHAAAMAVCVTYLPLLSPPCMQSSSPPLHRRRRPLKQKFSASGTTISTATGFVCDTAAWTLTMGLRGWRGACRSGRGLSCRL